MDRGPIPKRQSFTRQNELSSTSGISPCFQGLFPPSGQVAYVLLTRSPLMYLPKETSSLDLHVLSTPLAFILSHDQTLHKYTLPQLLDCDFLLNSLSLAQASLTFLSLFSC